MSEHVRDRASRIFVFQTLCSEMPGAHPSAWNPSPELVLFGNLGLRLKKNTYVACLNSCLQLPKEQIKFK